jgi:hypothetical protein
MLLLTLLIGLVSAGPASAAVIFDFSLPANGDVGAFSVQLQFDDYPTPSGLLVFNLLDPEVISFSSDTTIDPSTSVIGFEVTPTQTLIGLNLANSDPIAVLFTVDYPNDFFTFNRTETEDGVFNSISGTVASDLSLNTTTPEGTLTVSSEVPEPATTALLGLGFLGIAGFARRQKRSA